ncbi:tetratricopeptide repeat protein [Hymenobacter jeollabukensis]|uniref:Uncharacterized protein n=1 Tax=Hymenobacter jeollabukensis TaxID=2025313 RepID=A0A5R8WRK4_9BACT|nr:tetratricopeptide repeat protein [Hymenobacter jeollabukensis]TLM93052.1 hypothetical protein FDY95_10470 [Hymenobacter jeollabukensis]
MHYELPEHLIPAFQQHFEAGTALAQSVIILEDGSGRPQPKPGFWARRKARKALQHLQQCLALLPDHWPTLWSIGKVYQALREQQEALKHFAQAARIYPGQADVLREASIAAVDAGAPAEAVKYSAMALRARPDDAGLYCNHSINLLLNENDDAAVAAISEAIRLAPNDPINLNAQRLIQAVVAGTRRRPTWQDLASN